MRYLHDSASEIIRDMVWLFGLCFITLMVGTLVVVLLFWLYGVMYMSEFLTSLTKSLSVSLGVLGIIVGVVCILLFVDISLDRFDTFLTKHFPTFMERVKKREFIAIAIYIAVPLIILMLIINIIGTAVNLYILK